MSQSATGLYSDRPVGDGFAAERPAETGDYAPAAGVPAWKRYLGGPLPVAAAILLAAGTGLGGAYALGMKGDSERQQSAREVADLNQTVAKLTEEVQQLREQTVQLAATPRPQPPSLGPLTSRMDVLERAQKDGASKLQGVIEQQSRIVASMAADKREALAAKPSLRKDTSPTASLPPAKPVAVDQPLPPKQDLSTVRIEGFRLREVYGKMAVIEDKRGIVYELMKGESLPGIGRIQKLEKKGTGWQVFTDKGYIASK